MEIIVKIWGMSRNFCIPELWVLRQRNGIQPNGCEESHQRPTLQLHLQRFLETFEAKTCQAQDIRKNDPRLLLIWCENHRFNIVSMVPYHVHCPTSPPALASSSSKMSPRKDNTAVSLLQYLASRERIKVAGFAYGRFQSLEGRGYRPGKVGRLKSSLFEMV